MLNWAIPSVSHSTMPPAQQGRNASPRHVGILEMGGIGMLIFKVHWLGNYSVRHTASLRTRSPQEGRSLGYRASRRLRAM